MKRLSLLANQYAIGMQIRKAVNANLNIKT